VDLSGIVFKEGEACGNHELNVGELKERVCFVFIELLNRTQVQKIIIAEKK